MYALGQALPGYICDVSTWLSGKGSQVQGQYESHNKTFYAACLPLVLLQSLISAFKRLLEGCHSHASSRVLFLPTTKPQLIEEGTMENLREIPTMWPPHPATSRKRIKIFWFKRSFAFAIQSFYPGSVTQSKGTEAGSPDLCFHWWPMLIHYTNLLSLFAASRASVAVLATKNLWTLTPCSDMSFLLWYSCRFSHLLEVKWTAYGERGGH